MSKQVVYQVRREAYASNRLVRILGCDDAYIMGKTEKA